MKRSQPQSEMDWNKRSTFLFLWQLISDNLWGLVKLNVVFFFTCIPVVTLGPALSALGYCIAEMVRENGDLEPVREYFRQFSACFRRAFGWGLLVLALTVMFGTGLFLYGSIAMNNMMLLPIMALSLFALLCVWSISLHLFPMLVESAEQGVLREAAFRTLRYMGRTLAAVLLGAAVLIAQLMLFPTTIPLTLLLGLSLPALFGGLAYVGLPEDGTVL